MKNMILAKVLSQLLGRQKGARFFALYEAIEAKDALAAREALGSLGVKL